MFKGIKIKYFSWFFIKDFAQLQIQMLLINFEF